MKGERDYMPLKQFGIERPDSSSLPDEWRQYVSMVEFVASADQAHETKNAFDPRTWPTSTYIALAGAIVTAFLWAFNSGGEWKQLEARVTAIETRQNQDAVTYARRDVLEQQMSYVVTGLNELKVKVDQLTAANR